MPEKIMAKKKKMSEGPLK